MPRSRMNHLEREIVIQAFNNHIPIECSDRWNDSEEWEDYTGEFEFNFDDLVYRMKGSFQS